MLPAIARVRHDAAYMAVVQQPADAENTSHSEKIEVFFTCSLSRKSFRGPDPSIAGTSGSERWLGRTLLPSQDAPETESRHPTGNVEDQIVDLEMPVWTGIDPEKGRDLSKFDQPA